MCRQRSGVARMTDNPNTLEMIIHFLEVLVRMNDDNVACSLESRKLIPIISEVSDMNAEKRGEIHE
jgi:molecular chaperone GrpE